MEPQTARSRSPVPICAHLESTLCVLLRRPNPCCRRLACVNDAQLARPRPAPKSTKIFFGNKAFYCFFRLYQIIYDRLTAAKEMEKNSDKKKWAASILTPPKEMLSTASDGEKKDPYQVRHSPSPRYHP